MENTAIIAKRETRKQGHICPVCGLDWLVAKEEGYIAQLNHCHIVCSKKVGK